MADREAHNLLQGTGSKIQDLRISHPLALTLPFSPPCTVRVKGSRMLKDIKMICVYIIAAVIAANPLQF